VISRLLTSSIYPTENEISEKLEVGNWQSSQGSFSELADEQLALEENQGHFWNPGVVS
jgi:hypothetical protein